MKTKGVQINKWYKYDEFLREEFEKKKLPLNDSNGDLIEGERKKHLK